MPNRFAVGMFLDPVAALIILVPLMVPLLSELGLHPIQFGVMIVLNLMISHPAEPHRGQMIATRAAPATVAPKGSNG